MLTEKQIEIAARKLCELRGLDPDSLVGEEEAGRRQWMFLTAAVKNAAQVQEAIAFAENQRESNKFNFRPEMPNCVCGHVPTEHADSDGHCANIGCSCAEYTAQG